MQCPRGARINGVAMLPHGRSQDVVLQMPIDMFVRAPRGTALKLRLANINVSRAGLFYRIAEFTVGSPLIKSATAMCKYVRRWGRQPLSYNLFNMEHNVVNRRGPRQRKT